MVTAWDRDTGERADDRSVDADVLQVQADLKLDPA